ncbi:hypothetical protein RZS08_22370, partial [Arthrospira platensis SPKY1]|nr:hypothetical protein [Arthrospira platensis SPKY1]
MLRPGGGCVKRNLRPARSGSPFGPPGLRRRCGSGGEAQLAAKLLLALGHRLAVRAGPARRGGPGQRHQRGQQRLRRTRPRPAQGAQGRRQRGQPLGQPAAVGGHQGHGLQRRRVRRQHLRCTQQPGAFAAPVV